MLANLKANPDWAKLPLFDRKDWKRVRFGDVVEKLNETCDPADAGLERFIAMEHLEPGSLHVRSWGNVSDGTTFTRRCQPGQVLFGKRRAYQRKVAVAEFDAVVSGDIYVLASKDTLRLLPELLPFLCLSERFFQHAVGTSAGSLSPRTNWSSLAGFEFDLPPLDQQRRIAEILWAVDEVVEEHRRLLETQANALRSVFESHTSANSNSNWPLVQLEEVVEKFIDYRGKTPVKTESGVPLITARNVREGYLSEEPREFLAAADYDSWMRRGMPRASDILFTTEAPMGNVARVPSYRFALAQRIICLSPSSKVVDPSFFFWGMQSSAVQNRIRQAANGTTVLGIKQSNLRKVLFPTPGLQTQRETALLCDSLASAGTSIEQHLRKLDNLRASLNNTVFASS
ncbi:MAG: restriction endonuclease subunit S [Terrimicrobiaceae bacterium]